MNDKTEQALTDELRLAAKSAAPYGTAMIGASHLIDAADTIDNLRAENESLREQRNHIGLCIAHALSGGKKDDHEAGLSGRMDAIRALVAERDEAQRDAERLDWIIEHRAYVVSDPDCCGGYWLNYARPDGTTWAQATEHETPRAAIDAAKGEKNGA